MAVKVGLTGGIGSGKTTVAKIFEGLGIPVYYADEAARRLLNENEALKKLVIRNFGKESYKDGVLNRSHLASIVFADPHKLAELNALVHPVTIEDGNAWLEKQQTVYAIKEAALIFESKVNIHLDYVIGVYAPSALRIERAMKRDQITSEDVLARMKRQMNEEEKMRLCDFVITNNEEELVVRQVIDIHNKLLQTKSVRTGR
ncbi:MAG TPA: dephospho-CoA kinase [Flavitalea sp.]|nr:dephospho-CoA kinase [Flavitalea sp.]